MRIAVVVVVVQRHLVGSGDRGRYNGVDGTFVAEFGDETATEREGGAVAAFTKTAYIYIVAVAWSEARVVCVVGMD